MKKIALASILALTGFVASAANYASFDVDYVKDQVSKQTSTAQYVRIGKELSGIQYGLQSRTANYHDGSGMFHSVEVTAGKGMGMFTPFVGVGFDMGKNGGMGQQYNYGLVGATTALKVGPGLAIGGVKTRINDQSYKPTQSVAFATYSIPVTKGVALNVNASKSYEQISENAYGLGLTFGF